jgi:hypothetical protein
MNSTITTAAKMTEESSQSDENNNIKQDDIQHTKARLRECSKRKW